MWMKLFSKPNDNHLMGYVEAYLRLFIYFVTIVCAFFIILMSMGLYNKIIK